MKRFLLAAAALAPMRQAVTEKPRLARSPYFYAGRGYGKSELAQNMADYALKAGLRMERRNGSTIIFR